MKLNDQFFGHDHFAGDATRKWSESLQKLKPKLTQNAFAIEDALPQALPTAETLSLIKYDGMLGVAFYDPRFEGFAVWSYYGRVYYSAPERPHPVTEFFNQRTELQDYVFLGETYVMTQQNGFTVMTPFSEATSILKNPQSREDVQRIRFAVFDVMKRQEAIPIVDSLVPQLENDPYCARFERLRQLSLPIGVDSKGSVHLPDYLQVVNAAAERAQLQAFWNTFIRHRGFEGLVLRTPTKGFKLKFLATLDVVIVALKKLARHDQPACSQCMEKLDAKVGLKKLARQGRIPAGAQVTKGDPCPMCGTPTTGMVGCVTVALMTADEQYIFIGDVSKLPDHEAITYIERLHPVAEDANYVYVKPELVIEVSYSGLHLDRLRPVYQFEEGEYQPQGKMNAVTMRFPDFVREREDKGVNSDDLRLNQVSYYQRRAQHLIPVTEAGKAQLGRKPRRKAKALDQWF